MRFTDRFSALKLDPSQHKGELNPVEQVSYNDIQKWLEALYALSQIDDPVVQKIFPDNQVASLYRLPTIEEWEFIARNRSQPQGLDHFGDSGGSWMNTAEYLRLGLPYSVDP